MSYVFQLSMATHSGTSHGVIFFAISFRTSHAFVMATLIYHMEEMASCLVCPVTLHDVAQ